MSAGLIAVRDLALPLMIVMTIIGIGIPTQG